MIVLNITPCHGVEGRRSRDVVVRMLAAWATRAHHRRSLRRAPRYTDGPVEMAFDPDVGHLLTPLLGVHRFVRASTDRRPRRSHSFVDITIAGAEPWSPSAMPVRSYITDPYRRAIDHRTMVSTDRVEDVLAGRLDLLAGGTP